MAKNNTIPLYRIPEQGKIAGVCAGLAERFSLEVWLVRIVMLSALILTGIFSFVLLLYVVAWVLLDKKPREEPLHRHDVKTKVWQAGESPRSAFREVNSRFRALELRLQQMERYVTSDSYNLRREIDNLK
ncbi:envelope stress response membrane protein PspC [Ferrimonas marina]|uniref:Phage shock protein C (PspC) family protein n=1 Tax=Ferrimonas marina TaxID=299255 RepID=A0A1M5Y861_9GAMM|nr:envelope stress response membrane protein PspC [Ferrimonas marina]SHI08265.1 phage shock protein C (PspC) family protein [Ferrimonas marina]